MEQSAGYLPEVVDLQSVIATAELGRRAPRAPDYAAESSILASLAQGMSYSPELILQNLAQAALTSCRAGSAGISLIEEDGTRFRWRALKGELASHLGDTTPREFSPCGTVVDRNSVHLFSYLERHFKYFSAVKPTIVEALLVPFSLEAKPVGTIWVMMHDEQRRFDAEDARLIGNLGGFAAAAYQLRCALAEAEAASRHRDECLEILSHELRNPLFPMQLIADFLADEPLSFDDVKRASGVMRRQLKQLQHLVGDLKEVAFGSRGTIAAHSAGPGQGSEFVVRLPLCAAPVQGSSVGRLRVLVVDDHRDTADSLAWVLHNIGHEARAAYDGASAIRAFEELSPHVIFQDLLLPGTSGLEIAGEIRKRSASRRALLVAMTGAANAAALRAAEREAFDHLIVKPVGLEQLNEILGKASSPLGGMGAA